MKIKTELLKELIGKAIQCVGNNKLIPITQLMGIESNKHRIRLTTTDATNYMYVMKELDNTDNDDEYFAVTVFADQFSKLISKMTSEFTYLAIKDGNLEVKGNGTYTLELPLDEEGEVVKYPNPLANIKYKFSKSKIMIKDIKLMTDVMKPSIATTFELPALTNYYVGETVITANRNEMTSYDVKIADREVLMPLKLVDLLSIMENDIEYYIDDNIMVFHADGITIYSKWDSDEVAEFPIMKLNELASTNFKSVCKVNKNDFIALLERIALFVGKYDSAVVRLYFEKDGIRVSNKDRMSNELIEYKDSKKYKAYDCVISISMLLEQLKAYQKDIVEIHYNNPVSIKFVDDDITQIIALIIEK